jgi:hypothetical protein
MDVTDSHRPTITQAGSSLQSAAERLARLNRPPPLKKLKAPVVVEIPLNRIASAFPVAPCSGRPEGRQRFRFRAKKSPLVVVPSFEARAGFLLEICCVSYRVLHRHGTWGN